MMSSPPANKPGGYSFGRERHLRKRALFLVAYETGRRVHGRLTVLFGVNRADGAPWRLGLTATTKLGGAVQRNWLRRQGREVFRHWGKGLPAGWDFVLNFKHGALTATQAQLKADLLDCLRRMGIDPVPPGDSVESGQAPPLDKMDRRA